MKHKLIGLYQLITGIFGVLLLIFNVGAAIGKTSEKSAVIITFSLGLILFITVAYAGYALLNKLKNGRKISILAQVLQSGSFIAGGIQYMFSASAFLSLVYQQDLLMKFQMAPIAYNISQVSEFLPFELKIYIIPVILAVLLINQD